MNSIKPLTMRGGYSVARAAVAVQTNNGVPCKLWSVYKSGTKTYLATSNSVDLLPATWTRQSLLGENLRDATIVFDGDYVWQNNRWALYTEDTPWIFYITADKALHAKHGDTIVDLADNASELSAIRGWKNPNFIDRDQGIIVAYIRNSTIYYRSYCKQANGSLLWETEKSLAHKAGSVYHFTLASLNDYRVCFCVTDDNYNLSWAMTSRNWAGMAVQPDKITVSPASEIAFTKVTYKYGYDTEKITVSPSVTLSLLYGATANSIISVINTNNGSGDYGWQIDFVIAHESTTVPACTLTNVTTSADIPISSVTKLSDCTYRLVISTEMASGINDVDGDIKLDITTATNPAGIGYDAMIATFTPVNLVPTNIPAPVVEMIWNE